MATSITFQFWSSPNNIDWTGPHAAIEDVADSRYIKVKASLGGDANTVPLLEDMTVGYFKKTSILANWIFFNHSKRDAQKNTKTWTTKAELEGGVLSDVYCPTGLNQLELEYGGLSGYAELIHDAGVDQKANWTYLTHTKANAKTIWRDDFRANSISKYTWHNFPGWNNAGDSRMPTYDAGNERLNVDTWDNYGITLEIPGLSVQNVKASFEVYVYGYYPSNAAGGQFLRYGNNQNYYLGIFQSTLADNVYDSALCKRIGDALSVIKQEVERLPGNAWRTLLNEINGNSLKMQASPEVLIEDTDGSFAGAGKVLMGLWQAKAYIRAVFVEHYTLPSPVNNSITFQFATSDNGSSWSGWESNILNCVDSRYIKIRATLARTNLGSSAMPVLEDMTLGYFL